MISVVKIINRILGDTRVWRVGFGGSPKCTLQQKGDELPGISVRSTLVAARQLVLFSLDSMVVAVAFRLGGASIVLSYDLTIT
jgi:hypothetical protein